MKKGKETEKEKKQKPKVTSDRPLRWEKLEKMVEKTAT